MLGIKEKLFDQYEICVPVGDAKYLSRNANCRLSHLPSTTSLTISERNIFRIMHYPKGFTTSHYLQFSFSSGKTEVEWLTLPLRDWRLKWLKWIIHKSCYHSTRKSSGRRAVWVEFSFEIWTSRFLEILFFFAWCVYSGSTITQQFESKLRDFWWAERR